MKRELLAVAVFLAVVQCGVGNTVSLFSVGRIVGGKETSIESYPYQISLVYKGSHLCGGSIISEYFVLSAAHCFDSMSSSTISSLQIRAGSSYVNSGGTLHSISYFKRHSLYSKDSYDYDITIVRVKSPFEFGFTVQPIEIPPANYALNDGTFVEVSGWGKQSSNGINPMVLRVVEVPILNRTQCFAMYEDMNPITDRMVCAGYEAGGKDACQGDSGGPLAYGNILVGVTSWGLGCAMAKRPGVYTNVSNLRAWVIEETGLEFF